LIVNRTTFLSAAGSALAVTTFSARAAQAATAQSDITLPTATGKIQGTLTLPAQLPAPVVLIVAGSGPTDRDGDSGLVRPDSYKLLAAALAARGIASLRYDKRGIGASASAATSEKDLRFETYVDDAAAWLRLLHADARFSKVGVAGHSEGSLVAMLALARSPADAFVSLEGAGRAAPVVLREQLKAQLPEELNAQADAIIAQLQQGHTVANTPAELTALFRPSVQPYLISWFKYDPAAEISKLRVPVTIVQGTADVQITMADADALKAADPAARLIVVTGMNHVLKYAPDTTSQSAVVKGYEDASLPVDPHVVDAVALAVKP
jgi:pimeloyl-ACP methyl ester carboxylesterase